MNGACNSSLFLGPAPWVPHLGSDQKSNIIKFQLQSQFQRFLNQIFLTNKRYKTYQMGFSFGCLGHAPGVGLNRVPGGQKFIFSEHGHVTYQIEGDVE